MTRTFDIHYNDGAYYGTVTFNDLSQKDIETEIQREISKNNAHMDKYADHSMYHISKKNFKEVTP